MKEVSTQQLNSRCYFLSTATILVALTFFLLLSLVPRFSYWLLPGYNLYDDKRIFELVLLAIVALLGLLPRNSAGLLTIFHQFKTTTRWLLVGFFFLGVLSSCFAAVPSMALLEVSLYALLVYFIVFIAQLRFHLGKVLDSWFIGLVCLGALVFLVNLVPVYVNSLWQILPFNFFYGFTNPRFFAQWQVWSLLLVITPLLNTRIPKVIKLMMLVLSALWWCLALSNGSKALLLSLAIGVIVTALLFRRYCWRWLGWLAVSILLGLVLSLVFFHWLPGLMHAPGIVSSAGTKNLDQYHASFYSRIAMWSFALKLFIHHPLLGVGPMHYAYYAPPGFIAMHPHSVLLLLLAEWGLPATLCAIGVVLIGFYRWVSGVANANVLYMSLTSSLIAAVIYALISGVIITPMSQVVGCVVIGWAMGVYFDECHDHQPQAYAWWYSLALLLVLVAALVGLAQGVFPAVFTLPSDEVRFAMRHMQQGAKTIELLPRFWVQGHIQ